MVFNLLQKGKKSKVVDTVPASMYRTGMYTGIEMPMFCTGLNIGRTGHVSAILTDFRQYRPIPAYQLVKKKTFFFLIFSFVIFKFL